ncbi:DUF309 domain-containing protein [Bacillus tuaregi]|uniref:DUF309 domain-containing protein n=1 Tax=Bacillus tuaregi TaxID=1816695 RepID=UPI0008F9379D|nr:DUF309 domain-containing protein [Bacillus tuaregi]
MTYPFEYIDYLVHFHGDRDYFECHEILEDYWKRVDSRNKSSVWVGLIQLAVSNYHHRRGNYNGALRTLQKSLEIITAHKDLIEKLGLNQPLLVEQITRQRDRIIKGQNYQSMNLPIHSRVLLERCKARSNELQMTWMMDSDLSNHDIIHRHKKRDRSAVLEERNRAIQKKTNRRQ